MPQDEPAGKETGVDEQGSFTEAPIRTASLKIRSFFFLNRKLPFQIISLLFILCEIQT